MSRLRPEVLAEERSDRVWELRLRVPLELDCWPGHFPNWSVVPGVLQLDWVFEIIAKWLGCYPSLTRIEQLKFKRPMEPGREFTMKLERDVQGEMFRFHLAEGPDIFCVGRVALEAAPRADR